MTNWGVPQQSTWQQTNAPSDTQPKMNEPGKIQMSIEKPPIDLKNGFNYFESVRWCPEINLEIPAMDFIDNEKVDVTKFISKKEFKTKSGHPRQFDYIAWGDSLNLLRRYNPDLSAGVETYNNLPVLIIPGSGGFVAGYVYSLSTGRRTPSIYYSLRDGKNSAIISPDMTDVTNAIQRVIAKAIAQFTGLGWTIYAGQDESIQDLANPGERPNDMGDEPYHEGSYTKNDPYFTGVPQYPPQYQQQVYPQYQQQPRITM